MGKLSFKKIDWSEVAALSVKLAIPFGTSSIEQLFKLTLQLEESQGELAEKVQQTSQALTSASRLVNELQTELADKLQQVERLKLEYEKYQQLAGIEQEKSAPLMLQVKQAVAAGQSRERWIAFAINLIAGAVIFLLGMAVSPYVTDWSKTH